ncbi:MAG: phosphotransferase, partial [Nocardioidaceae bacterium]
MDTVDSGLGAGLVPLAGGYSGETFLAEAAGERSVVRIYAGRSAARGANAAEVDAAVLRLVRGLLPVPEVLEVRRADPSAGTPALLVTGWLAGTRLDELLPDADDALLATVGRNLGRILARLAQIPMLRTGSFVDGELRIGALPPGAEDLPAWVEAHRGAGALAGWTQEEWDELRAVAERAQELLDRGDRVCLVHSDFNSKNLLVDPATGEVTGLLDWEFAHAGSPYSDLGNLLRFDRRPPFAESVLSTYAGLVVDAPDDLLDRARAADLWALVDL